MDENNEQFNGQLVDPTGEPAARAARRWRRSSIEAGYALDLEAIREDVGDGVWGRPHVARALVRAGHAEDNDDAFDRFLHPEHALVTSPTRSGMRATSSRSIRAAGGISSLAHAVWYKDVEAMARALAADGLDAIEVFHPDHGPEQEARLGQLVNELGLAVTAGSDFHGTPEGRKRPGGVSGDGEMLGILRARRPAARSSGLARRPPASDVHLSAPAGRLLSVVENAAAENVCAKNYLLAARRSRGAVDGCGNVDRSAPWVKDPSAFR